MKDKRIVSELLSWLKQFDLNDQVYAYEGEVQGIIVIHKDKYYTFHNEESFVSSTKFRYPQIENTGDDDIE